MGIVFSGRKGSKKTPQELAKKESEAYNKKSSVEESQAVDLTEDSLEDDESAEDALRYNLSTMKKAGLKEYAEDNGVDIEGCNTNKEIVEKIVLDLV